MDGIETSGITQILIDWNSGDEEAKERLIPFVYDELKRQARILMSRERSDHTLQPTALVHEAFIRIGVQSGIEWQDRSHFYGIASRLMRQILVQHAHWHAASKRGNKPIHYSIDDFQIPVEERAGSILALNDVLEQLEKFDEQQAKIDDIKANLPAFLEQFLAQCAKEDWPDKDRQCVLDAATLDQASRCGN